MLIAQAVQAAQDPWTLIAGAVVALLVGGAGTQGIKIAITRKRDSQAEAPPPATEVTPFVTEAKCAEVSQRFTDRQDATNSKVDHMAGTLEGVAKTTDRIMDHLLKN